jgi:hypothetical protein
MLLLTASEARQSKLLFFGLLRSSQFRPPSKLRGAKATKQSKNSIKKDGFLRRCFASPLNDGGVEAPELIYVGIFILYCNKYSSLKYD